MIHASLLRLLASWPLDIDEHAEDGVHYVSGQKARTTQFGRVSAATPDRTAMAQPTGAAVDG